MKLPWNLLWYENNPSYFWIHYAREAQTYHGSYQKRRQWKIVRKRGTSKKLYFRKWFTIVARETSLFDKIHETMGWSVYRLKLRYWHNWKWHVFNSSIISITLIIEHCLVPNSPYSLPSDEYRLFSFWWPIYQQTGVRVSEIV